MTFCPATAGVLSSLHGCTKSGLSLANSLLLEQIISPKPSKWSPIFVNWHLISQMVPILGLYSGKSEPLTHRSISMLRTSINKFQTDLSRILAAPEGTLSKHLHWLVQDLPNLRLWLKMAGVLRLTQLRRLINSLQELDIFHLDDLNIDTVNATYVVEWVTSRHSALSTTASTAIPLPLDTLPNFVPEILIKELIEGHFPQLPWQYSIIKRIPTPLPSQAALNAPRYSPNTPVYNPIPTPPPSEATTSPLTSPRSTPLPIQSLPLPSDPSINPSILLQSQPLNLGASGNSNSSITLPPIATLEETLPVTARLIRNMDTQERDKQRLIQGVMNLLTTIRYPST